MILTDKAKEDFKKYARKKGLSIALQELFLNALIIEWLDSVGVYVSIRITNNDSKDLGFWVFIGDVFLTANETRQEATQQAIIKANEIYNNIKRSEVAK